MKRICPFVLLIIISMSYSFNEHVASGVGLVILNNYAVNANVLLPDAINHKFIVTAEEFYKTFHMTKATPGTAIVPEFTRQFVVAIILPPTEKVVSIDIHKAETDEKDLNIYYTITDTTSWTTYPHIIKAVAAVDKSNSVKQVNFYNNNIKERTFFVEH